MTSEALPFFSCTAQRVNSVYTSSISAQRNTKDEWI